MAGWVVCNISLQEVLDEATHLWGIKVERVEIKDVKLPQQLQRAMAAEAEASREARAKVKRLLCNPKKRKNHGRRRSMKRFSVCFRSLLQRER